LADPCRELLLREGPRAVTSSDYCVLSYSLGDCILNLRLSWDGERTQKLTFDGVKFSG